MADVAATLVGWSSTTSSNTPSGGTTIGTGLDDNLREIQGVIVRGLSHKGADIASATTTDLGAVEGLSHDITGTTTITGLGTVRAGIWKIIKFEGALTLTHNATSLILPGGANITTADGDVAIFESEASGNWRCVSYFSAAGGVVGTTQTLTHKGLLDLSGAAAGQIKFPATQNASSNANTLDDYEEGTWTASLVANTSGTITLNASTMSYVKVGGRVDYAGAANVSAVSSPVGSLLLQGLPFTPANNTRNRCCMPVYPTALAATATTAIYGKIVENTAEILITKYAAGAQADLAGDVQVGSQFVVGGSCILV